LERHGSVHTPARGGCRRPNIYTDVSVDEVGTGRERRYRVKVFVWGLPLTLTPGRGCVTSSADTVLCTSPFDTGASSIPTTIRMTLGDKDDTFVNRTSAPATIYGSAGDDALTGGSGADVLVGGAGSDEIRGQAGNDELYGGDNSDKLFGGLGDDLLRGGNGGDRLDDDYGDNRLYGEGAPDALRAGTGHDIIDGGVENDTVDYSARRLKVVVNLRQGDEPGPAPVGGGASGAANYSGNDRDSNSDDVSGGGHSGSPGDICHVMEDDAYIGCEITE
jgi:Ca2+-binding RTX toxin-like protein